MSIKSEKLKRNLIMSIYLIEIPPTHSVDKIIGKIKGYTSKVLREEYPSLKSRLPSLWTRSKFVSSCGSVTLEIIKDYIEGQSGQ